MYIFQGILTYLRALNTEIKQGFKLGKSNKFGYGPKKLKVKKKNRGEDTQCKKGGFISLTYTYVYADSVHTRTTKKILNV